MKAASASFLRPLAGVSGRRPVPRTGSDVTCAGLVGNIGCRADGGTDGEHRHPAEERDQQQTGGNHGQREFAFRFEEIADFCKSPFSGMKNIQLLDGAARRTLGASLADSVEPLR